MDVSIHISNNTSSPEVLFIASKNGFTELSIIVLQMKENTRILLTQASQDHYDTALESCNISFLGSSDGLLSIRIEEKDFVIQGDLKALEHLAYYFDFMSEQEAGFRWHIDYFEGNQDVLPTTISLVLQTK